MRVWPDGASEYLGRPDYAPVYADGSPQTRDVVSARVRADVASPGRFDAMAPVQRLNNQPVILANARFTGQSANNVPVTAYFTIMRETDR